jgi:hypothetical protein
VSVFLDFEAGCFVLLQHGDEAGVGVGHDAQDELRLRARGVVVEGSSEPDCLHVDLVSQDVRLQAQRRGQNLYEPDAQLHHGFRVLVHHLPTKKKNTLFIQMRQFVFESMLDFCLETSYSFPIFVLALLGSPIPTKPTKLNS